VVLCSFHTENKDTFEEDDSSLEHSYPFTGGAHRIHAVEPMEIKKDHILFSGVQELQNEIKIEVR
jgi:hypothetical protein